MTIAATGLRTASTALGVFLLASLALAHADEPRPSLDPAMEQALIAADWPRTLELTQAWLKREPANLVPSFLCDWAVWRLGQPERMWEAAAPLRAAEDVKFGNLQPCVDWAQALVSRHSDSGLAWQLLSHALWWNNDPDKALEAADQAVRLTPDDGIAFDVRALSRRDRWEYKQALADHTKAIKLNPRDAVAYNNRGTTRKAQGDLDGAIEDYTKAIELNPKYAEAYANRGNPYYQQREYTKAIADYTKAVELNPCDAVAYNSRGNAHDAAGEASRALDDYTLAIELNPKYAAAYYNRAITLHYHAHDPTRALPDYEMAAQLRPTHARTWYNKALACELLGRKQEAIDGFRRFLTLASRARMTDYIPEAKQHLHALGIEE